MKPRMIKPSNKLCLHLALTAGLVGLAGLAPAAHAADDTARFYGEWKTSFSANGQTVTIISVHDANGYNNYVLTPTGYTFAGSGTFRDSSEPRAVLTESGVDPNATPVYDVDNHSLVLFDRGDEISVQAGDEGIRFLLVSGKPIEEPVAWYGPIVMNTQEQIRQAMADLQTGEFIKHH